MADSTKSDLMSAEANAPSDMEVYQNKELREDLIATAVKFLQNPKVRESPLAQRKAFLERKGLNKAEIDLAVYRSGTASDEQAVLSAPNFDVTQPFHHLNGEQSLSVSGWTRIKHTASTVVVLGAAAYAIYQLYDYLAPAFRKKKKPDDYLESIGELRKDVTELTASIKETNSLIQKQQRTIEDLIRSSALQRGPDEIGRMGVSEVKDEIRSLKALLLNKNQFPAVPTITPLIPSWQLQQGQFDNVAAAAARSVDDTADRLESAKNDTSAVKSSLPDSAVNGVANDDVTTVEINGDERLELNLVSGEAN